MYNTAWYHCFQAVFPSFGALNLFLDLYLHNNLRFLPMG